MESIKNIFNDKKNIPIVFAFNDDYAKYFSVAFQSIIDNSSSDKKYDLVAFVSSDVKEKNKQKLLKMKPDNFSLRFFDIEKYISDKIELKTLRYYSKDIYYRLFIPFLFQEYKKVLYIDSDTVVDEDIKNLKTSFKEEQIAAVIDTIVPFLDIDLERKNHIKKDLKLKNENNYFNSGVLIFNIEKINLAKYKKALLSAFNLKNLSFPDQDMLNKIFDNKVKFLNKKWNFHSSPYVNNEFYEHLKGSIKREYTLAKKAPKLIHYASQYKPWNNDTNPHYEIFWKYAKNSPFYKEILTVKKQATALKSVKFKDLSRKIKNNKKILFWGASDFLKEFLKTYKINSEEILGIIDSNSKKEGKFIENYKIFSPKKLRTLMPKAIIITIINGNYYDNIEQFIKKEKLNIKLITLN